MQISLSNETTALVQDLVRSGSATSAEDYIANLVRQDAKRHEAANAVQQMVDNADASGVNDRTLEQVWQDVLTSIFHDPIQPNRH